MIKGKTIVELAQELQDRQSQKQDFVGVNISGQVLENLLAT